MIKNRWVTDYVKENYHNMSDREMAKLCGVNYVSIFNIRKKHKLERSEDFKHQRQVLAGTKGGTSTQKKHNYRGENNWNWKGGISKNTTHYFNIQKLRYPEKIRARRLLINARKRGDIIKLPCIICQDRNSFAHHEDYSKPLEVIWLCRKHHTDLHRGELLINQPSALIAEHKPELGATIIEHA